MEAVEVGQVGFEVLLEPLSLPMRPRNVLNEAERASAQHVPGGKQRVLFQLRGAENAVKRIGKSVEQRSVRSLQSEDHAQWVGRLDRIDIRDQALAYRNDPLWRIANSFICRLDVLGRERRAIVEFDA